eukprot:COSAG02_NODE_391_length_23237_cov_42.467672_1_plen_92_part_00
MVYRLDRVFIRRLHCTGTRAVPVVIEKSYECYESIGFSGASLVAAACTVQGPGCALAGAPVCIRSDRTPRGAAAVAWLPRGCAVVEVVGGE